jgi:hypothetical protein
MAKYIKLGDLTRIITEHPRVYRKLLALGAVEYARDLLDKHLMRPVMSNQNQIIAYEPERTPAVVWSLDIPTTQLEAARQALLDVGHNLEESR